MKKPPPSPEAQLTRILHIAKINGLSVAIIAGLGTLLSLGDWWDMAVGMAIFVGGWMELQGRKQLLRGDIAGLQRLVRAQWVVLGAIEIYCVQKLGFDPDKGVGQEMRSLLIQSGFDMATIEPMLRQVFYASYGAVALLTLVYQGGMARYYRRRTGVVQEALAARLRPVLPPVLKGDPEDWVT